MEKDKKHLLIILDRDGTIIENDEFFGRSKNWKKELKLKREVVDFLIYLNTKYKTFMMVVSNQSGVARGLFSEKRVMQINKLIDAILRKQGIKIVSWKFSPFVDRDFAQKNPQIKFIKKYIKEKTDRKPNIDMVIKGLKENNKQLSNFKNVLVVGNNDDDKLLAKNLNVKFIDVKNKFYDELLKEFKIQLT